MICKYRVEQLCAWGLIALLVVVPLSPMVIAAHQAFFWFAWIVISVWAGLGGAVQLATRAFPVRHSPAIGVVISFLAVLNTVAASVYFVLAFRQ